MKTIKKEELTNPVYLKEVGLEILEDNLGIIGTAMFLQQFSYGSGDYTKERTQTLENETIDDFERDLAILKSEDSFHQ